MGQEVKIGVQADTAAADRGLRNIEKTTDAIGASLGRLAKEGIAAADAIRKVSASTSQVKSAQSALSRELGAPIGAGDAQKFLENFQRMRGGRGIGSQRLSAFNGFDEWYHGHGTTFKRPADAAQHRRMVMSVGMQGTQHALSSAPPAPPPGGGGGGGGGQAGPSPFMRGVQRAGSSAMSFGMGMLGLAGISSIMGMAASALDMATEEATGIDTLKRKLGDVGVSFDGLKDKVHAAAEGMGITHVEAARLAQQFSRVSGRGGPSGIAGLGTALGAARSFGVDPAESTQFFGTMRNLNVAQDEQGMRRMSLMIADAIEKGGFTAKADEVLRAVADFAGQAARLSLSSPNVSGYAAGLSGLTSMGYPGLDPSGAASILSRANSSLSRGGALGDASMNTLYSALNPGGDPVVAQAMMAGGLFGTSRSTLGPGSMGGDWFKSHGIKTPGMSDVTNIDKFKATLRQQYGSGTMYLNALQRSLGLSSPQEAMALDRMQPADVDASNRMMQRLGIDPSKVNPSGALAIAKVAGGKAGDIQDAYNGMLSRSDVTQKEKDQLQGLNKSGDMRGLQDALARIFADRGQEATDGSKTRQSVVDLKDLLTDLGTHLMPAVNTIRDAVVLLAYGKGGAPIERSGDINATDGGSLAPPKSGPRYAPDGTVIPDTNEGGGDQGQNTTATDRIKRLLGMDSAPHAPGAPGNLPRGTRMNNPGNLRSWGKRPTVGGYAQFDTPEAGLEAMADNLQKKQTLHHLDTLRQVIGDKTWGWAPASDGNNVEAYLADMKKRTGFGPDDRLNLSDPATRRKLLPGFISHENGQQPYSDAQLDRAAGMPLPDGDPNGTAERGRNGQLAIAITGEVTLPVKQDCREVGAANLQATTRARPSGTIPTRQAGEAP